MHHSKISYGSADLPKTKNATPRARAQIPRPRVQERNFGLKFVVGDKVEHILGLLSVTSMVTVVRPKGWQ